MVRLQQAFVATVLYPAVTQLAWSSIYFLEDGGTARAL
jgi:hypothetical protein